jgi:hypothetical protein
MTDESSGLFKAIEKLAAEFGGSLDHDSWREKLWAQVPEPIRKDVEQHVAAHLPADMLAKWLSLSRSRQRFRTARPAPKWNEIWSEPIRSPRACWSPCPQSQ